MAVLITTGGALEMTTPVDHISGGDGTFTFTVDDEQARPVAGNELYLITANAKVFQQIRDSGGPPGWTTFPFARSLDLEGTPGLYIEPGAIPASATSTGYQEGFRQLYGFSRDLDPSFSLTLHDLTGAQARMKKGGLAGISKGELVVLLRPSELSAIAGQRVA